MKKNTGTYLMKYGNIILSEILCSIGRHLVLGSHFIARSCVFLILIHFPVLCSHRAETKDLATKAYSEKEQRFWIRSRWTITFEHGSGSTISESWRRNSECITKHKHSIQIITVSVSIPTTMTFHICCWGSFCSRLFSCSSKSICIMFMAWLWSSWSDWIWS
jgi:hypothetical protein